MESANRAKFGRFRKVYNKNRGFGSGFHSKSVDELSRIGFGTWAKRVSSIEINFYLLNVYIHGSICVSGFKVKLLVVLMLLLS